MRTIKQWLVGLYAAVAATVSAGQSFTCNDFAALTFSPRNPGPTDAISWFRIDDFSGVPAGWSTIARPYLLGGNQILIDIVVTADVEAFPGYEIVEPFPRSGSFGPLPAGRYIVGSTVRTFDLATQVSTPQCVGRYEGITVLARAAPTTAAPVIEFYNPNRDHYFLTQDPLEAEKLDLGILPGWVRTGQSFIAYVAETSDGRGSSVARLYGLPEAGLDTHVFTALGDEIVALLNSGTWMYETSGAFELVEPNRRTGECPPGTRPLYRLWNGRRDTNHRYTTDVDIRRAMLTRGWIAEGWGADVTFLCAL